MFFATTIILWQCLASEPTDAAVRRPGHRNERWKLRGVLTTSGEAMAYLELSEQQFEILGDEYSIEGNRALTTEFLGVSRCFTIIEDVQHHP